MSASEMDTPQTPATSAVQFGTAVADMRQDYRVGELLEADLAENPFIQFDRWFADAWANRQADEPHAMTLATSDAQGIPSARTVLLKGFDERGFSWFTNYESRKGRELTQNPNAALVFRWATLERQVIICGPVTRVDGAESDEYFNSRPAGSRIGAIVSAQSTVLTSRADLDTRAEELRSSGIDLVRPHYWGGFRLAPITVEFWQGRPSRLHDRLRFRRADASATNWTVERLSS
jgi:pyridoxamine 5'-phosphate oxidase